MAVHSNVVHLVFVVTVIAGILSSGHQVSGQTCQGDFKGLVEQCSRFVQKPGPKVPPSPECCAVVRKVDVPCVCSHITKDVEKIISMDNVVYVAGYCGKKLAAGTKCGSFTVP